jgi:hypothetical protein
MTALEYLVAMTVSKRVGYGDHVIGSAFGVFGVSTLCHGRFSELWKKNVSIIVEP